MKPSPAHKAAYQEFMEPFMFLWCGVKLQFRYKEGVWLPLEDKWVKRGWFVLSGLYQMSVPESAPVGSVVGRIWAKDRDIGVNAEMKYSIIDGDGRDTFDISTDATNLFGIITVKKVNVSAQILIDFLKISVFYFAHF